MLPTIMLDAEIDLDKRTPFRAFWFADQVHPGFLRSLIRLLRIATDARANNVFPRGRSATISWDDVIQIQVFTFKDMSAVLAGIPISLKNVVPRKFDLLFWKPVKHHQQDHPRHTDFEGHSRDGLRVRLLFREISPLIKAERLESAVGITKDDLGMAFEDQRQRAAGGANIHRLPEPVEHEDVLIKKRAHIEQLRQQAT
jgi:hypothetical protein